MSEHNEHTIQSGGRQAHRIIPTALIKSRWGKRTTAMAGMTAALLGTGIAYATWTNSASGNAASGAGTLSLTVVSAGSSFTNKLFPGAVAGTTSGATAGGDLVLNVTNPQNFPVKITAVTQNGPVTETGGTGSPACTSDTAGTGTNIASFGNSGVWVSSTKPSGATTVYTQQAVTPNVTVAANATNVPITLPNVVSMDATSANGCQGATFTMPVTVAISM